MANTITYNGYDKAGFYRFTVLDDEENIIQVLKIAKVKQIHEPDANGVPVLVNTITYANKDEALAAYLSAQ
ncbi:MAG: hypothetical protein JNL32_04765 [Candidatus Kapabacteria bacterium]|nr:hypothetical protein [Candidatus Kapabacteria bacterium]